jgi:hypothetical protein
MCVFYVITGLILLVPFSRADVPNPPAAPPTPAGYCSTISNELKTDLKAFNLLLETPPIWTPVPGNPTIYAANLQVADANTGPAIGGSGYLSTITAQLNEEKALGAQAVEVQIGFPVLYAPFQGGQENLQPYLTFYQGVAQAVKALGMKLIVENDVLLASDIQSGWPNLADYFSTLSWTEYMQARATMAATLAETMQPDYLILAEEPDTEALQSGQANLNNPTDAAQMISGEISAVRASSFPNSKLGAGFGSWPQTGLANSVVEYAEAYVALPLDYIDSHIYPINTVASGSLIGNILTIASLAAAAGKPIALSEYWLWKMENSEWNVMSADNLRGRDPLSFWQPLDIYFQQTMQNLANYTNMVYVVGDGPDYLFTYQTYGGTTANGGAANCTCTTTYCDSYDIVKTESNLAKTANDTAAYSTVGIAFANQLVQPPDTTPPSKPTGLTGSAGYTGSNFSWTASTDNVGVAGYNVFRCSPPAQGQSCKGVLIANITTPAFLDSGLSENTAYNYQVQAFDLANNNSALSSTLSVQTYKIPTNAPSNLVATPISATEIELTWSAPQDTSGLTGYVIFSGPSGSSLVQIATVSAGKTTYKNEKLIPSTYYYYGVEAVENGVDSQMTSVAYTPTYGVPNAPTSVVATPASSSAIALSWQQTMAHNGLPIANYKVLQGTTSGQLTQIATVTGTTYTSKSLKANTAYYYEVVAVDTAGDDSSPSSEVSATTQQ